MKKVNTNCILSPKGIIVAKNQNAFTFKKSSPAISLYNEAVRSTIFALNILLMMLLISTFTVEKLNAQCTNTSQFGSATINAGGSIVTVSTCSFGGEFSPISGAVAGQTLRFTSSVSTDFITIHSGSSNGPVVAFGTTPLVFANTFTGTLYAHWNTSASCGSTSICRTTTVQCTSCTAPPPVDPCTSITAISACGVSVTSALTGSGSYSPGSCGFSTPGQEKIYAFTPATTGTYLIQVTAASGGFVDYFYKAASGGCSGTGWTCIDDINSAGNYGFLSLIGGTQYYFMTDAEGTSARSQTFNLSCAIAYDPCASITNISACGVSVTSNHAVGIGAYNPPNNSCGGFATPGQENIYTFTPATTGTYNLQVTAASGGFVDYFYKDASGGCSGTGWTCIDDINSTGTYGSIPLTAGIQYYIMTDPEVTTACSQTFNFICIQVVANDFCVGAIPVTCGSTISGTTVNATSTGENISCSGYSVGSYGVWYVLPGNGELVTVTTCDINATADLKIHVFSGSCGNLTCVGANDDDVIACPGGSLQPTVRFLSVTGVDYYILVSHFSTPLNGSPFNLNISCVPYAPCINIANLTCGVSQTTLFATGIGLLDPVSTSCGFADVGLEKIYTFTPTVSGFHQISQTSQGSISYYFKETANGCSASGWTCIDHLNGAALTNTSAFNLVAGTEYYIMLKNGNAAGQYLTFSLVCPAGSAPANDLCAGAISLTCGATVSGTTVNATSINETALSPCGVTINTPGVWYVFAGNGQQITVSTCSAQTGDSKISVFTGSCGSFTCEGGNDDVAPVCGTNGFASSYSFLASTGVNYYILVHGNSGTLNFNLSVTCLNLCTTPLNDHCAGAQTLAIESGVNCNASVTGDNSCNTAALFNPTCDAGSIINDNWYTFSTGNCTSNLTINLAAVTAVGLRAVIYSGTCGALTEVSCHNLISGPITLTGITANTTYYLQVYTTHTTPGTYSVCVNQNDVTPPTIICTAPVTINTTLGLCTGTTNLTAPTMSDNCAGALFWSASFSGNSAGNPSSINGLSDGVNSSSVNFNVGTTTVTLTATDLSSNTATCSFTVTVNDTELPTIVCNAPITVSNDIGVCGAAVSYTITSSDNCTGQTITQTSGLASGSIFPIGTTTNAFTVTDASGNTATCSFTVTVNDAEAPSITCNANITTSNDNGVCGVVVNYTVSSSDNCPNSILTQTSGLASGSTFPIGTTTNIFMVTDASGNTATCSFTVTVNDTEAPSITCNANITTTNDNGVCGALVNYTVTSNDNCAGQTIAQTAGLASGSIFPIGTTTNAFTVTDASGNTATCSFTVTVNDTELPTINCPANIVTCDPLVTYTVTANDHCGSPTITYSQASGTMFAIGTTMVKAIATDMYGNKDSCTFTVLVKPTSVTSSSEDVCDEYIWVENNNTVYNTSGMYSQTFTNMYGCDSVHTLNLIVRHSTSSVENVTAANSYTWLATTLTYTTAGTYTHTLTNAVGCDSLLTLHLSIITINAQRDANISCHGSNDGTGQAVAIGGTGNFVYDIDGGTSFINTTGYFQNLSAGIHTICAKELPSNVVVCDTFEITEPTAIVIILTVDSTVSCLGNDGGISASITGGVTINQPYLTTWSSGAPGMYDTYVTGLTQGTYTISVKDDNNCQNTSSITLGLTTPLSVSATQTIISCYGGSSVITPITNGGTGTSTTSISGGSFMVGAGTYTVSATDSKGCTATTEIFITQPALIENAHSVVVCESYTWIENGNTTYTQSGTYTQTYTTVNGCDSIHTLYLLIQQGASSTTTTTISQFGCYTWPVNNVTYTVSGSYTLTYSNATGCDSTSTLNLTITPGVYLRSKVFLSACYVVADGLMHDSLRLRGIVPNLEPYSAFPYNKAVLGGLAGEVVSNAILSITGPNAIVDWIFLELRSASNPSMVVETKRALLQRDGDIVSHVDGVSPVFFPASANDDYYVSVKHRNHLGVMTSTALSLRGCTTTTIDFTSSLPVYTNGGIANSPRKLMGGVQTLWSSDANNNKNSKYNGLSNDKDKVLESVGGPSLINSTVYGYRAEDVNMDGKVRYNGIDNDRNVIVITVGISTPNNMIKQHTPN